MRLFQPDTRQRRMLGAVFAISFVMAVLLTAFFQAQVLSGASYATRSEENRLRPVVIPAPRGTILDRNGEVVATSITSYSVAILPGQEEVIRATLLDLAPFLALSAEDIEELVEKRNGRPNDLLEVTKAATFAQAAAIEERRGGFSNLLVVEQPRRYYPAGEAIGHLAGYVGEISPTELEDTVYSSRGYQQGRLIGKAGIEKQYEFTLTGRDGARFVEVDAMGRVVDPRATVGRVAPRPGEPLRLTLDLELQKYIYEIFPDTMRGAVVAMIPSTGEVLAMVSNPSYDPNDFVGRIPSRLWGELNTDPAKPLLDRTVNALYPPASTWKTATALVGIQRGLITDKTVMPIPCTGGMSYANRYARCWDPDGHGLLNLGGALENSCNVWFYQLGIRLGLAELSRAGTRMGFSRKTGIDLPVERTPTFPTGLDWYRKRFNYVAPSEVMSLSIGQGPNDQSVLSMTQFYAAIAGTGTGVVPHLVDSEEMRNRETSIDLDLTREQMAMLWEGLRLVTEPEGTALQSSLARYKLYGKTGTAQNPQGLNHGWFTGFAGVPGRSPEIAIAIIVEEGLHGSDAAPLAAKAVNFYLDRKYGHPFDPEPTLGERWRAGKVPYGVWDERNRILVPPTSAGAAPAAARQTKQSD